VWKAEVNDVAHTPLGATWTGIHPTLKSYVDVAFAAGAPRPVSCIMCRTLHHFLLAPSHWCRCQARESSSRCASARCSESIDGHGQCSLVRAVREPAGGPQPCGSNNMEYGDGGGCA
jgi:hypothetical protein